jgi:hypothetical protein
VRRELGQPRREEGAQLGVVVRQQQVQVLGQLGGRRRKVVKPFDFRFLILVVFLEGRYGGSI